MSGSPHTRRAVAEIDFSDSQVALFKIGDRSIHQFWHLFSAEFRHVLLAPQRRPDSGRVAWSWREAIEKPPVTATELAEVRRRLTEANRSLSGGFGGLSRSDDVPGGGATLEGQVRGNVREMVGQLVGRRDLALSGFVCRTDAGLMLHSWGAAVAAHPYYPEGAVAEISGTVFAGAQHLAGVAVVLENANGTNAVRVQSDKEGVFHFPGVVAGSYSVRVADRSDFSGSSVAVTMERDSITGLELRSTSTESISMATNLPAVADHPVPWYKSRVVTVIAVLILLGGAAYTWRAAREPANQAEVKSRSSGWQSAHGQLSANGGKNTLSADERKVGEAGAFSTLSRTISSPKPLNSHLISASGKAKSFSSDKGVDHMDDSRGDNKPAADDKNRQAEPREKSAQHGAPIAGTKPSESRAVEPVASQEASHLDKDSGSAGLEDDDSKRAETMSAKSARGALDKKSPAVLATASSTDAESASETFASDGRETAVDPTASSTPGANEGSPHKAAGRSSTASGKSAEPSADADSPDAGDSDSVPEGGTASASGQLKPAGGKKSKESAKGTSATEAVSFPAASTGSVLPRGGQNEAPSAESVPDKNSPKSVHRKKAPTGSAPAQAEPPAPSDQENSDQEVASASSKPTDEVKKQPQVAASKRSVAANPSSETPASSADSDTKRSDAQGSPSASAADPALARSKTSKKRPGSLSSSGTEDEKQLAESLANSSLSLSTPLVVTVAVENRSTLVQVGSVQVSAWKPRIIQDLIVPTRPVTAEEEEALETLRSKLLQERATKMPGEFEHPRMRSGFAIEFAKSESGQESPRWRNDAGLEPAGSSVHDQQAELEWDAVTNASGSCVLSYPDGRVIAEVKVGLSGVPALRISSGARASYWFGIESATGRKARFDWRLLSGAPIPNSWTRYDQWHEGHGQRVNIPLDATTRRTGNYEIALTDQSTGWALVGSVTAR